MVISGVVDDTKLGLSMLIFSVFAMFVLSFEIGVSLVVYAFIYVWAISRKPVWGYQFSKYARPLTKVLLLPLAIFLAYIVVNDLIIGGVQTLGFGSSLQLYSTSLQSVVTIDMPIVRFLIWGVLIPILETMFFIGVVGYLIAKHLKVEGSFYANKLDTWVTVLFVGGIASVVHIISQLTAPALLIMDIILFGICMVLVLKDQDLKRGAVFHVLVNSTVLIFVQSIFAGGLF